MSDPYKPKVSAPRPVPKVVSLPAPDVPDGTVAEVLEWVGDDYERAYDALDAERTKDSPRVTLISQLETMVGEA